MQQHPPPGSALDWRTAHRQPRAQQIPLPYAHSVPTMTAFPDVPRFTTLPGNILLDSDLWARPAAHGGAVLHDTFVGPRGRLYVVYRDPRNNTLFYTGGPVQRYG
jgi:hypothetical protein